MGSQARTLKKSMDKTFKIRLGSILKITSLLPNAVTLLYYP